MPHGYGIYAASSTAYLPHDLLLLLRHKRRVTEAAKIDTLIKRIGAKLFEIGLSEREASIDATGKPDALRYIRTRRAMPGADRLEQIAATLGTSSDWLLGKTDAVERLNAERPAPSPQVFRALPRNLPVYGTALGADLEFASVAGDQLAIEQTDINMAEPREFMPRPTSLAGQEKYYVITVQGHSMEPRFDDGRRLLVNGGREGRAGEDVVVQLKRPLGDTGDEEMTSVLVKRLVRKKAGSLVLSQHNPPAEFEVPISRVHAIHPITPWDEALGY
jgi:phage repressor protein C with HTH and peptisase S24 domain